MGDRRWLAILLAAAVAFDCPRAQRLPPDGRRQRLYPESDTSLVPDYIKNPDSPPYAKSFRVATRNEDAETIVLRNSSPYRQKGVNHPLFQRVYPRSRSHPPVDGGAPPRQRERSFLAAHVDPRTRGDGYGERPYFQESAAAAPRSREFRPQDPDGDYDRRPWRPSNGRELYASSHPEFRPQRRPLYQPEPWQKSRESPTSRIPGHPGIDYPVYHAIPETSFDCGKVPYRPGMYADPEADCQVYHVCSDGRFGRRGASFLCTNGTLFNQREFTCDWWYNVDCGETEDHYGLNLDPEKNPYFAGGRGGGGRLGPSLEVEG